MSIVQTFNSYDHNEQIGDYRWSTDPGEYQSGWAKFGKYVSAPVEGMWQEGFTKAGQAATIIGGGLLWRAGFEEEGGALFEAAMSQKSYWDSKKSDMSNTTQQMLYGIGGFAGKMWAGLPFGGPAVGGAIVEGTTTATNLAMEGVSSGTSIAQGMWKGATFYTMVSAPGSWAPQSAIKAGGATLTAWRAGYGLASNLGLGIVDRAGEKLIFAAAGEKERAAAVKVFDPLAMSVDSIIGLALGGAARYADYKSRPEMLQAMEMEAKTAALDAESVKIAESVQAKIAKMESERINSGVTIERNAENGFLSAKTEHGLVGGHVRDGALHISTAEVSENMRGKGEGVRLYTALIDNALADGLKIFSDSTVEAGAVRVYEALERRGYNVKRLEGGTLEDGAVYGKDVKNPAFEIVSGPKRIVDEFTPQEKAYIAAKLEAAKEANFTAMAENLTVADVDAAMHANLDLKAQDSALGIPGDSRAMQAHMDAYKETLDAMNEGRMPDLQKIKEAAAATIEDPRLADQFNARMRETLEEIPELADAPVMPDVPQEIKIEQAPTARAVEEADIAVIDQVSMLPDDVVFRTGEATMTKAEMIESYKAELTQVENENKSVADLFSCFLGGA